MTTAQAADILEITESLVRRYCRDGRLKAELHGRNWWITEAEVKRFKAKPRVKTGRKAK